MTILETPLDISNWGLLQMPFYEKKNDKLPTVNFSLLTYVMCSMLRDIADT